MQCFIYCHEYIISSQEIHSPFLYIKQSAFGRTDLYPILVQQIYFFQKICQYILFVYNYFCLAGHPVLKRSFFAIFTC